MIKSKKIIIWGMGKVQKDFEYIFTDVSPVAYICNNIPDDNEGQCIVYREEQIGEISLQDYMIIICVLDIPKVKQILNEYGWKYKENYIIAEDLFYLLDSKEENLALLAGKRKVVFWGTGNIASKNVEIQGIFPDFYIDSKAEEKKIFNSKEVISPESIVNWSDLFCVILTAYYDEIIPVLKGKGLKEKKDFIVYKDVPQDLPSHMMKKTVFDVPHMYPLCKYPFNRVVVYNDGNVMCCCEGMKTSFGNIIQNNGEEIWNSVRARIIRLSIINMTYSFCCKEMCPFLQGDFKEDTLLRIEREREPIASNIPEWVQLNIDYTCNLRCTSCRTRLRIASGNELERINNIADRLIESEWLLNAERLSIAGDGEALFSPTYKRLIFDIYGGKRKQITIGTNGNLLNRKMLDRLTALYESINFSVSVDAATNKTYEKIRKGGNFEKVRENIELLKEYKKEGRIKNINMVFVVQKDNYHEMIDFVEWAKKISANVIFYAVHNWGTYTEKEFAEISMINNESRELKPELLEIMQNSIWESSGIEIREIKNLMHKQMNS